MAEEHVPLLVPSTSGIPRLIIPEVITSLPPDVRIICTAQYLEKYHPLFGSNTAESGLDMDFFINLAKVAYM